MGPYEKSFKTLVTPQFLSNFNQTMINVLVMGDMSYYHFGDLPNF